MKCDCPGRFAAPGCELQGPPRRADLHPASRCGMVDALWSTDAHDDAQPPPFSCRDRRFGHIGGRDGVCRPGRRRGRYRGDQRRRGRHRGGPSDSSARAKVAVIEASSRIGGRCSTESATFGVPFDHGAHWIHMPDLNPVTPLAKRAGFEIYPAPPWQRVRLGRRNARAGEMGDSSPPWCVPTAPSGCRPRTRRRGRRPGAAEGFGRLEGYDRLRTRPVRLRQGPRRRVRRDFARSAERDTDAFCRQGVGAVIAKLADGLPVQLSNPVTRIEWAAAARSKSPPPRAAYWRAPSS